MCVGSLEINLGMGAEAFRMQCLVSQSVWSREQGICSINFFSPVPPCLYFKIVWFT